MHRKKGATVGCHFILHLLLQQQINNRLKRDMPLENGPRPHPSSTLSVPSPMAPPGRLQPVTSMKYSSCALQLLVFWKATRIFQIINHEQPQHHLLRNHLAPCSDGETSYSRYSKARFSNLSAKASPKTLDSANCQQKYRQKIGFSKLSANYISPKNRIQQIISKKIGAFSKYSAKNNEDKMDSANCQQISRSRIYNRRFNRF